MITNILLHKTNSEKNSFKFFVSFFIIIFLLGIPSSQAITYYYNESLPQSTTTSTTFVEKLRLDFTPDSTKNYTILAYAEVNSSSTSAQVNVTLDVDNVIYQETRYRPKDVLDIYPFSAVKKIELSNAAHTVKINYSSSSGAATAKILNAKIVVMEIDPEYNESETQSTTTGTAQIEKVKLVFTPSTAGNYLIIASANFGSSSTTVSANASLFVDGAGYANSLIESTVAAPNSYFTFGVFRNVTLTATQHVINLTYNSETAGTTTFIRYAHVAAIRLSDFSNSYLNESESAVSPTVIGTWYNKVINEYTSEAADHLLLYTTHRKAGTGSQIQTQFLNDSTTHVKSNQEAQDATDYWSHFWFTKSTLSAASHTDIMQYSIPGGTTTNFGVKFTRIAAIQIRDVKSPQWYYQSQNTSAPETGGAVLIAANWTDVEGLGYAVLETNETGTFKNYTGGTYGSPIDINLTAGQTWSNFTWLNSSVTGGTTVAWRIYANDTTGNQNVTDIMNFTIQAGVCAVAIARSSTLASGISFGNIDPGNSYDAPGNNGGGVTDYYLTLSISGCTPNTLNVYTNASGNMISGDHNIPVANLKYRNSTTDNTVAAGTYPNISLTTTLANNQIGSLLTDGSYIYLKYNLTVPVGQRAATGYSNTVFFWAGRSDLSPP